MHKFGPGAGQDKQVTAKTEAERSLNKKQE